jgi:hypothetical protein
MQLKFKSNELEYIFTLVFLRESDPMGVLTEYIDMIKRVLLLKDIGDNILIDEDGINIDNLENKSSLLMNGLLLGYNKSILDTEYNDSFTNSFDLGGLITLIMLEKDNSDISMLLGIFNDSISGDTLLSYMNKDKVTKSLRKLLKVFVPTAAVAASGYILAIKEKLGDSAKKAVEVISDFVGATTSGVSTNLSLLFTHCQTLFSSLTYPQMSGLQLGLLGLGLGYFLYSSLKKNTKTMLLLLDIIERIYDSEFQKLKMKKMSIK